MEAEWFEWLVEFDNHCDWTLDGHANCVSWLVDHCGMARPTAKDKLRVAHQLARRASIGDAYRNGELSYSKVRAITRIDDADFDTDQRMLELARVGDTADVERAVRHWQLIKAQDQPPDAIWERRGLRRTSKWEGNTTNQLVLPDDVDQRLMQILDGAAAVDKVSAESADPMAPRSRAHARADALVQLVEAGLAHLAQGGEVDPETASVNVIVDYETLCERAPGTAEMSDSIPLSGEAARRLACDAKIVRIITRAKSEVLDVGRQTREWNRAQRRAIRYRHHNQCAFKGCHRTILHIHHCDPWGDGGPTDLDAGIPLCWAHHHMVHEGAWTVRYHGPTATVTFTSPTGHQVEAPARRDLFPQIA